MSENQPQPFQQPSKDISQQGFGKQVKTSSLAIISFVLGIVSLFCSFVAGIPGIICGVMALGEIGKSNGAVKGKGLAITGIVLSSILSMMAMVGILIGMMLPAVQQVREAARRTTAANSLRQLQLSQLNYEDANNKYPGAGINSGEEGAGLSWRVHILPYLEEQALYQRFNLNEPWDSEHNKALIPLMPEHFVSLGRNAEDIPEGHTVFLRPIGNGAFPDPAAEPYTAVTTQSVTDGTAQSISLLEANPEMAQIWTKPDADYAFDPANPAAGIGSYRISGFNAVMMDGSVQFISNSTSPAQIAPLYTHSAGD